MRVCPYCNRPILDDSESCLICGRRFRVESEFCPICGKRFEVEKVERLGTVDITATPEDINDWRRDEMVFTFFCLAFLGLGTTSMLLDFPVWCTILCTILCFIALAVCLAVVLYSHRKVTDLKCEVVPEFWTSC